MSDHFAKLKGAKSHDDGCIAKHEDGFVKSTCSYRYNGWEDAKSGTSLKGRVKKNWYNWDFRVNANAVRLPKMVQEYKLGQKKSASSLLTRADPKSDEKAWCLDTPGNFQNAFTPYNHNHHHIMPWTCLKSNLNLTELDLVQAAKYNLNDKDNMILLPCNQAYGIALKLPDHPYAHASYNTDASDIVNQIKEAVNVGQQKHDITATNSGDFKKMLVDWQKRQYDKIVDHGEKIADDFVNGLTAPSNQINECPMADAQ
jgi:hypothetical protein